jgi:hypothetical protein
MLYHSCGKQLATTKKRIVELTPGRSKDGSIIGKWPTCVHCHRILRPQDCTETVLFVDAISKMSVKSMEIGKMFIESIGKMSENWV